jgi:tRNA nucleotidyltransferase (CCA-adding enzyme)
MAKVDSSDVGQVVKLRQQMNDLGYQVETGPIAMYFLTKKMSDKDTSDIQRMIPRRDFVDKWKHLESGTHDLAKKLTGKESSMPSGAWRVLTQATPENILFLALTTRQQAVDQKLKNFFTKWRQVKEKLPFAEMPEMRITPSLPEYPELMEKAFLLLLDGKLRSHTEIVNFLKPYEPPPPPPPPAPKRGRGKAAAVTAAAEGQAPAAAPAKRGRKPKGAAVAPAPAVPEVPAPAPAPPKPEAKPAPTKAATKAAPPAKAAAKKAPPKPAAKAAKPAAKKPAAKKPAPAKKATKKAPPKKAKKR